MWLLLLFHFLPILLPFLIICSKGPAPSDRNKEKISSDTKTLRRDLANSDAPSVQGSVVDVPQDGVSVIHTVYRCPSMSGQRPKSRQVPMTESVRARFNKNGSQMQSIQVSTQQSTAGSKGSVLLSTQQTVASDPDYFRASDKKDESQMASVSSN